MRGILQKLLTGVIISNMMFTTTASADALEEPAQVKSTLPVIVVDAGHGGPDSGARASDGTPEKQINLAIAKDLASYLRQGGYLVAMTRTEDTDLASDADRKARRRHLGDLGGRFRVVKRYQPDVFVSVHCNAIPSPKWRGAQTIYMTGNEEGKKLAKEIQESMRSSLLPTERDVDDIGTLFLLKRISGPAALVEVGFLSNPDEAAHLKSESYQEKVAFAIYTGIVRYTLQSASSTGQGQVDSR